MCSRSSYRRPRSWCGHPWKINRLLKVVPGILSSSTVLMFDRHPSLPTSLVPSPFPVVFPPDPSVRPVHFLFQSLVSLTLSSARRFARSNPARPERPRYSRNYTLFLAIPEVFFLDGLPNTRTRRKTGHALLRMGVSISLNSRVDDPTTTGRGRGSSAVGLGLGDGRERATLGRWRRHTLERARASRDSIP
jgi:hypothetical protein